MKQRRLGAGEKLSRRRFIRLASAGSLAASPAGRALAGATGGGFQALGAPLKPTTIREFLTPLACTRQEVEMFLDPAKPNWAQFDPELGYTLRDNVIKDGVDGSRTLTSYQKTGERTTIHYAARPCRINTYGDSFTQCHQASDGETWQEYLAAHLGEPIRNFGIGGYGTYQAFRRMQRVEATSLAAPYVILNIWDIDDYLRSIDQWRWLRFIAWWRKYPGHLYMFHGNPWVHIRLNLETGELVEKEHQLQTLQSLYQLADPEFVVEHFKDDLVVKLLAAQQGATDVSREEFETLARVLGVKPDFSSLEATAETARQIQLEYALRAGIKLIEKVKAYATAQKKRLMVLLSSSQESVARACEGRPRPDQAVIDFLKASAIPSVDGLGKHVEDFKAFNLSPREYIKRYYIGHYNPRGNHFYAFAIKDAVVAWLDPKPVPYREGSETIPPLV